jgi:hypothetical protein
MVQAFGDIKTAGQRHAIQNFVNSIESLKYEAIAWAKKE